MDGLDRLARALGPEARLHVVGGWVRDRGLETLGRAAGTGDLDLATALRPQEVIARATAAGLRTIPTGLAHGTVTVLVDGRPLEVTTFRGDGAYLDGRRPAAVTLGVSLEEDLARRDFTINALALPVEAAAEPDWRARLVDPFGGFEDLRRGLIRAVGDPLRRFAEDGLRPLRACRFASQLGFDVEAATAAAIPQRLEVCAKVAVERAFAELTKLLCGQDPARGLRLLEATGLLDLWLPELRPMVGCPQNRHHRFDVWEHTLKSFDRVPRQDPAAAWALLLHDAGKPASRTIGADGEAHFHGHEEVSVGIASVLLRRLRASKQLCGRALALVAAHGLHPRPDWSDAAVRRLLKRLDESGLTPTEWQAFCLADRWGKGWGESGHPDGRSGAAWWADTLADWDAVRRRLEASRSSAMTVGALALDGHALMHLAGRPPGPWLGRLQAWLLDQVLEAPAANTAEALGQLARTWLDRQS